MAALKPSPEQVNQAIETYIGLAYDEPLPVAVRSQLSTLRSWKGEFFRAPVFVPDSHVPPTRYSIRFGNRFYPHMKLVFERSPDNHQFLFRVDTHDKHICPAPNDPDYANFLHLMEQNQKLAEAIETSWAKQGLPTFKTYLRDDLAKRQAK